LNDPFKSIRPFHDEEVEKVVFGLLKDKNLFEALAKINYPTLSKIFIGLTRNLIRNKFKSIFGEAKSIRGFQSSLAPLVEAMIKNTTLGFSISGEENFLKKPTIFIGNHRDISLDSLFLNFSLFQRQNDTVRIAIGDNLLDGGYAEKIMRLNKSFVVHRNISGVKETFKKLSRLSKYINLSIEKDQESVWIAQKEGRAIDGNDFTDEAVLKMLHLDQRKKHSIEEWVSKVNLTPIVISYELDPLDGVKAKRWKELGSLSKGENNERGINELIQGIIGQKGRVHLHICKSLKGFKGEMADLVRVIDKQIIQNFKLWPINHAAAYELSKGDSKYGIFDESLLSEETNKLLKSRLIDQDIVVREKILNTYATPLINKQKSQKRI
tara:strand:- start:73 stop:1215 length:1143 start_codon:yes stop_codon:yes gene_type:complete